MAGLILFGVCFVGFFIASIIMPWVNRASIGGLREEIAQLRKQRNALIAFLESQGMKVPPEAKEPAVQWEWQRTQTSPSAAPGAQPIIAQPEIIVKEEVVVTPVAETVTEPFAPVIDEPVVTKVAEPVAPAPAAKPSISFEQQFGARLPVWIGGVALALAGFFLVKYSIEIGLLSPFVRVVLGVLFGLGLLNVAEKVRTKPDMANGKRIAQALSGAGIADLYISIFAATTLYHFLPSFIGFIGLAAVTATAVRLSLRHGMPIAILGLVGGLLTPAMVASSDPSAPLLFLYLYGLVAGMMVVIRRQAWWGMAVPTMLGGFAWTALWALGAHGDDSFWLGLFTLATSTTYVLLSPRMSVAEEAKLPYGTMTRFLNYLSLGGAALMMALVVNSGGYGLMGWSLYGLLALGSIVLAHSDQERYGFTPWLAAGTALAMLLGWREFEFGEYALVISAFAGIFIAAGYYLQSRSERPLLWTGLITATGLSYYLVGYAKLHHHAVFDYLPYFWGLLACTAAATSVLTLKRMMLEVPNDHPQKAHVLAIYAAQAAAFITLGLTVELEREFLSVAVALQVLAIAWITTRVDIPRLREIAAVLAIGFGGLLMPQIILLAQLTMYSLFEAQLHLQAGIPMVNWPLFQLGLPALAFLGGSYLLRQEKDDRIVRGLEVAAIALAGVMGYYLTRHAFHMAADVLFVKAGFFERGVITNILLAYGLGCVVIGRHTARQMVCRSGVVLACVAAFRIGYFDLIAYNPIWATQSVGILPIFNKLLLTYGVPLAGFALLRNELRALDYRRLSQWLAGFMLLVAFTLTSLEVRQLFHGDILNDNQVVTNAEIYSYSVAWLLLGLGLLLIGTVRKDKMTRVASLALMILTVGKVFLYDASELEGLYRVVSFFGLGVSLLGLSWFYTRHVFGVRK